ncbi:hypothetical protein ACFUN8_18560 [Streptomyces sp. NPDC057307]|uniref:hypothetical protein n=1 Tax=Streptomyces sp. NPDC057307 TaxID=3346096 RepID=UPI00363274DF
MALNWGTITIGRISLRETINIAETGGAVPTLAVEGREESHYLTRAGLYQVHENILALTEGQYYAVTFEDKPERNGYYVLATVSANLTDYQGEFSATAWKLGLERVGAEGELDIQSRLTGTVRANAFTSSGTSWHAPAIGHYSYYTGASVPSILLREGEDADVTVYRNVPEGAPRWGAAADDYYGGCVRVTSTNIVPTGAVLEGTNHTMTASAWSMDNGLVNVNASGGALSVGSYSDGAYQEKTWLVTLGGVAPEWRSVSLIRNDPEQTIVRLTSSLAPGRVSLDLTLRRGSRFVELYLQTGSSATLSVHLQAAEANDNHAASGYVVATSNDPAGDKFTCGSARAFTAHADGGLTKTSAVFLDCYLGVVRGGTAAEPGDEAAELFEQYIGALAESTYIVRR